MNSKITMGLRLLLGLIYTVFGLNFFLHFIAIPPMPEQAGNFIGTLISSGFSFQLLKVIEVSGGLLLLSGFYVPLALVLLAPITVNIFLFHAFLAPTGMFLQAAMFIIHIYLGYAYREYYTSVFTQKAKV